MTRHCAVLILMSNTHLGCDAAASANSWSWREGRVNPAREHLELRFGPADEGARADCIRVARVGPPVS